MFRSTDRGHQACASQEDEWAATPNDALNDANLATSHGESKDAIDYERLVDRVDRPASHAIEPSKWGCLLQRGAIIERSKEWNSCRVQRTLQFGCLALHLRDSVAQAITQTKGEASREKSN